MAQARYPADRNHWRKIAGGLAAILLVGLGLIIGRTTAPKGDVAAEPSSPSTAPTALRNEAGAVKAATEFVRVLAGPSGDVTSYVTQVQQIAAPQWRSRAKELADNAVQFVEERYGEGGSINFEPLRYRVQSHSVDEATIDIWGVVLGAGPKITGIEESWITGTVDILWTGSQWKVSGQSSKGGPTPELLRTEEDLSAAEILGEFTEYGNAAGF